MAKKPATDPQKIAINPKENLLPWGPVAAVVVTLVSFIVAQLVAAIVISIYPVIRGWSESQTADWLSGSVIANFLFILLVGVITLLMLWLFLRSRKATASQLGIKRPRGEDVAYALIGFGVYVVGYVGLTMLLKKHIPALDSDQKQELGFSTYTTGFPLFLIFCSLVVMPPIIEETLFRGFLYTGLKSKLPKIIAAVTTSVLFAVAHLQFGSGKGLLWVAALDTFVLSMVLVYLREKTDSLWSPVLVHMLKNGIAFYSLFILHL